MAIYVYSVSGDTANGTVLTGLLYQELIDTTGDTPSSVSVRQDVITIDTVTAKPSVDAVVSAHDGSTEPAGDVSSSEPITQDQLGTANGIPTLDGGGKIPSAQLPATAIPSVSVVADSTARLALTVEEGDEAIQTDDGSQWIYDGSTWIQRVSSGGDVTGPASATAEAVALFDGTTGKVIQNSGVTIDGSNNLNTPGNITLDGTVDGRDVNADGTKLDGIESGAEVDDKDIKVSSNDSTPGFLATKLIAGTNVTLNELNDGGNETLQISASAGSSAPVAFTARNAGGFTLPQGTFANVDLTEVKNTGEFSFNTGADTVTVNETGTYYIGAYLSIIQPSGNNRTSGDIQVTLNGTLIPGMVGGLYSRNANDDENTAAVFQVLDLTAGDVLALQARRDDNSLVLETAGAALVLFKFGGPQGIQGPPGTGTGVDVKKDNVDVVTDAAAVDFIGDLVTIADGGSGVATVTVNKPFFASNADDAEVSTTAPFTTPATALTLAFTAPRTGDYKIEWYFEAKGTVIGAIQNYQVTINGGAFSSFNTAFNDIGVPSDNVTEDIPCSGFYVASLVANTSYTITILYGQNTGGGSASIRRRRLTIEEK